MSARPGALSIEFASGLSGASQSVRAAELACDAVQEELGGRSTDLALFFFTAPHVPSAEEIAGVIRRRLDPACLVGVSAESVVGGAVELERVPGISLLAGRLPGVALGAFTNDALPAIGEDGPDAQTLDALAEAVHAAPDTRAVLIFADPFTPLIRLLPALNRARRSGPDGRPAGVILGGMASASAKPEGNRLILNGSCRSGGLVGVTIAGDLRVDAVVSQGCRPFGSPMVITRARHNLIFELGGRPALDVLNELIQGTSEEDRHQLQAGLLIGRVINEYKDRFGRDDFLIRGVMGVDPERSAIAIADLVRVGQTVQFHLRDARTAAEDLAMLMDAQKLHDRPVGGLLITCNARGSRMFGRPGHDAACVVRAFQPTPAGEARSKGGVPIGSEADAGVPPIPLAGFFAAGEIGPVGTESFLHGHSACVALFRRREPLSMARPVSR